MVMTMLRTTEYRAAQAAVEQYHLSRHNSEVGREALSTLTQQSSRGFGPLGTIGNQRGFVTTTPYQ